MPSNPSWVSRKLLNLRPIVHPYLVSVLVNGKNTSLWYDNWHPLGPFIDKFGPRIIYDSGIPRDATVSHIMRSSSWVFPITQTPDLNEVRGELPHFPSSRSGADINASGPLHPMVNS